MMGNGKWRRRTSCTAACVLLASAAQSTVQTRTYSDTGQGLATLRLFDPTLGTLLSVSAEACYTSWLPYLGYGTPIGYDRAVTGLATLGSLSFAINGTSQVTPWTNTAGMFTVAANGSASWTAPAEMALFAGTSGSILGYAATDAVAPGLPMGGSYRPSVSYKLTYTYDNSAAVPEPATWAMMIGGFALTGLALRTARRKRRVVSTSDA